MTDTDKIERLPAGLAAARAAFGGKEMSILKCDSCDTLIDTDDCPEAYDEKADKWWCYLCFPDYDDPDPVPVQRYKNWTQGK